MNMEQRKQQQQNAREIQTNPEEDAQDDGKKNRHTDDIRFDSSGFVPFFCRCARFVVHSGK